MILDLLAESRRYELLHGDFKSAFAFLKSADWATLPYGRHSINGDRVYCILEKSPGRGRRTTKLEAHRHFIDIRLVIAGKDLIGWKPTCQCSHILSPYDSHNDLEFFRDRPDIWIDLPPGHFAIFFPEDAHAPMSGTGDLVRVVVKVQV